MVSHRSVRGIGLTVALVIAAGCTARVAESESTNHDVRQLLDTSQGLNVESMNRTFLTQPGASKEALHATAQLLGQRLRSLGAQNSSFTLDGQSIAVHAEYPRDRADIIYQLLAPGRFEIRPVLEGVGRLPQGSERETFPVKIAQIREALNIPPDMSPLEFLGRANDNQDQSVIKHALNLLHADEMERSLKLTVDLNPQPDQIAQLATPDGSTYRLGPVRLDSTAFRSTKASSDKQGRWLTELVLRDGPDGVASFNQLLSQCALGEPVCGSGNVSPRLAIVLDGVVLSAPSVDEGSLQRDRILIPFGSDSQRAAVVATLVRFGPLPVDLVTG